MHNFMQFLCIKVHNYADFMQSSPLLSNKQDCSAGWEGTLPLLVAISEQYKIPTAQLGNRLQTADWATDPGVVQKQAVQKCVQKRMDG